MYMATNLAKLVTSFRKFLLIKLHGLITRNLAELHGKLKFYISTIRISMAAKIYSTVI